MIHTKELPSFMNSLHTLTALLPFITAKKITKRDTNIPSRHSNTPRKLSSIRKKPIGNLQAQRESHKDERTYRNNKTNIQAL